MWFKIKWIRKIWSRIDQGEKKDDDDKIWKKSYKVVAKWRKIYKKKVEKWKKKKNNQIF